MDENVLNGTQPEVVDQAQGEATEATQQESANTEATESVQADTAPGTEADGGQKKQPQSKEDNAKFAEIRRKYEAEKAQAIQKAKDDLIAEQYGESHGIYTESQYKEAVEKAKRQAEIDRIQTEKQYSPEDAAAVYEARMIKEQAERQKADAERKTQETERIKKENADFLQTFEEINGRAFTQKDGQDIPAEVWEKVKEGVPLKYAYLEMHFQKVKQGQAVQKQNNDNATAATGSVQTDGVVNSDFISATEFEKNRGDADWVRKNYNKIIKSRPKW